MTEPISEKYYQACTIGPTKRVPSSGALFVEPIVHIKFRVVQWLGGDKCILLVLSSVRL